MFSVSSVLWVLVNEFSFEYITDLWDNMLYYYNKLLDNQIYGISILLYILIICIMILFLAFIVNIIIIIYSDKLMNYFTNKYIRWYIAFNKKIVGIKICFFRW